MRFRNPVTRSVEGLVRAAYYYEQSDRCDNLIEQVWLVPVDKLDVSVEYIFIAALVIADDKKLRVVKKLVGVPEDTVLPQEIRHEIAALKRLLAGCNGIDIKNITSERKKLRFRLTNMPAESRWYAEFSDWFAAELGVIYERTGKPSTLVDCVRVVLRSRSRQLTDALKALGCRVLIGDDEGGTEPGSTAYTKGRAGTDSGVAGAEGAAAAGGRASGTGGKAGSGGSAAGTGSSVGVRSSAGGGRASGVSGCKAGAGNTARSSGTAGACNTARSGGTAGAGNVAGTGSAAFFNSEDGPDMELEEKFWKLLNTLKDFDDDLSLDGAEEYSKPAPGGSRENSSAKTPGMQYGAIGSFFECGAEMKKLKDTLCERIVGQPDAVNAFVEGIISSRAFGIKSDRRPRAIFVFAGPPGVGKTLLAETGAAELGYPVKRFDMSELSDKEQGLFVLNGTDKVYRFGKPGVLTEFVKNNNENGVPSVLIFDEIEKAHINVIHVFLQILDAGRLMDVYTQETVDFANTYIIFTTNAGRGLYEGRHMNTSPDKESIIDALRKDTKPDSEQPYFPESILSRMGTGYMVMFRNLRAEELSEIALKELERQGRIFKENYNCTLDFDSRLPLLLLLARGGECDARNIRADSESLVRKGLLGAAGALDASIASGIIAQSGTIRFAVDVKESRSLGRLLETDQGAGQILYIRSVDGGEEASAVGSAGTDAARRSTGTAAAATASGSPGGAMPVAAPTSPGGAKPAAASGSPGGAMPAAASGSSGGAIPAVASGSSGGAMPGTAPTSPGGAKPGTASGRPGGAMPAAAPGSRGRVVSGAVPGNPSGSVQETASARGGITVASARYCRDIMHCCEYNNYNYDIRYYTRYGEALAAIKERSVYPCAVVLEVPEHDSSYTEVYAPGDPLGARYYRGLRDFIRQLPIYEPDADIYVIMGKSQCTGSFKEALTAAGVSGVLDCEVPPVELGHSFFDALRERRLRSTAYRFAREKKKLSFRLSPVADLRRMSVTIRLRDFKKENNISSADTDRLVTEERMPDVGFADYMGGEQLKAEAAEFIEFLRNPRKYYASGKKQPRGLLLYGPPGTGKTFFAKAFAHEAGVPIFTANGSEFVSRYTGGGAEDIRTLFSQAGKYAPSIVFIDEIDSFGRRRTGGESDNGRADTLNMLLSELDGFNNDSNRPVFFIAATNYGINSDSELALDPALVRRFTRTMLVDLPDYNERREYLKRTLYKEGCRISSGIIESIARRSVGMNYSDLGNAVEKALRDSLGARLTEEILDDAFETIRYGEKKEWSHEMLERTAWHETGHCYMSYLQGEVPEYITITARGNHGGYVMRDPGTEKEMLTGRQLLDVIRTALAGRAAEMVRYGSEDGMSTGAAEDIEKAGMLVNDYICKYGMDKETGLVCMAGSDIAGLKTAERCSELLNSLLEETVELLENKRVVLEGFVEKLLAANKFTRDEIKQALDDCIAGTGS